MEPATGDKAVALKHYRADTSVNENDGMDENMFSLVQAPQAVRLDPESFDEAIDNLVLEGSASLSKPIVIPDFLEQQQGLATPMRPAAAFSLSSVLRMSIKARSSVTSKEGLSSVDRFKKPTPISVLRRPPTDLKSPMMRGEGAFDISSNLFDDDLSTNLSSQPQGNHLPPLSLFDLSGTSLPPTNQVFPELRDPQMAGASGRYSEGATSFQTGMMSSNSVSVLVPATQYDSVVDMSRLLPTTPSLGTISQDEVGLPATGPSSVSLPPTQSPTTQSEDSSNVVIPPTQQLMPSRSDMSQMDLFTGMATFSESIPESASLSAPSEPSFTKAIISTPNPTDFVIKEKPKPNISVIFEEVDEDDMRYSGHETVVLPDSFGEDDEDNPFKEDTRISEAPILQSQAYLVEEPLPRESDEPPKSVRKVRLAPTPEGSSLRSIPMNIAVYSTRTETQELEIEFTTSLSKLCKQVISVPRSEESRTPVKDVEERIMTDGDIEMKPKTPLRVVSRSASEDTLKTNVPVASASKTLTKIIQALSSPKKLASGSILNSPRALGRSSLASPHILQKATPKPILIGTSNSANSTPRSKVPNATPKPLRNLSKLSASITPLSLLPGKRPCSDHAGLAEGSLVWAHWRLQYFTAGILERKKSKSRAVWQVRPLHRKTATLDLGVDHLLPIETLNPGDPVLHITDRRKYAVQKGTMLSIDCLERMVELDDGQRISLEHIVIDRNLFSAKHKEWKVNADISSCFGSEDEYDSENEPRYSLTGKGVDENGAESHLIFSGLSFVLTGVNFDRNGLISKINENGGKILDDFPPEPAAGLVLISSEGKTNRTAKYYSAIILGVDIVKPAWIDACISAKKVTGRQSYLLEKNQSPCTGIFGNVYLSFVGSKTYKDSCIQVAALAGATLVDQRKLASCREYSVIVVLESLDSLKPRLQAACLANGHLITEKAWFIDSILGRQILPVR